MYGTVVEVVEAKLIPHWDTFLAPLYTSDSGIGGVPPELLVCDDNSEVVLRCERALDERGIISLELVRECIFSDGRVENEGAGLAGISFMLAGVADPETFEGSGREPLGRGGRADRRSRR